IRCSHTPTLFPYTTLFRSRSYDSAKAVHINEHQAYYNRVQLTLGAPDEKAIQLATDELLEEARDTGRPHPCLVETFFQYGRYLRSEEHTSELQSRENLVCR